MIYAIALGTPAKPVTIKSMGKNADLLKHSISAITQLGSTALIHWTQNADSLKIDPAPGAAISDAAVVSKIATRWGPSPYTLPKIYKMNPNTLIHPGLLWPDNRGKHIQAHGGGIIKLGDTWFWFGEDRSKENDPNKRYVACYASKDLAHWEFRNQVIALSDPENFGSEWVLERPKVFYSAKTGKYVLYMHVDGRITPDHPSRYSIASLAVATCDTIDGDYEYQHHFRPLGLESRDIGQFIDDDGTPYLIFECRPTRGFYIASLSEDCLKVEREVAFIKAPLEGGSIVHYEGLYYVIGSALTGWWPNANKYATAERLEGPWSEFKDFAPVESHTYMSQSTNLIKVTGTKATTVIYAGDRWRPEEQWDSRYLWMPVEIGGGHFKLPEPKPWSIDVVTGQVTVQG